MRIGIGVDTGGTFTDCVLVDLDQKKVVAKAKSRTTYANLREGITRSLDLAIKSSTLDMGDIKAVALSTTLATNALIEGRGARVGLLLIGINVDAPLPSDITRFVKGGHTVAPDGGIIEIEPLDEGSVESACADFKNSVDAVAIVESFGTHCSDHEIRAKAIVSKLTQLPVTCGHELCTELGFYERAVTAAFNSKLIPVLSDFIRAVESELKCRGINAPVFIVKSDGTLTSLMVGKERPVETILTGPAASVIGARYLTGMSDMIMIDQGGTTCLTSIVRGGWPTLDERGATIASYRTRVKALKIRAIGLGGDSHIRIGSGNIEIGPRRLIPLCVASSLMPQLKSKMRKTKETYFVSCPEQTQDLQSQDADLIRLIMRNRPATLEEISRGSGFAISSLEATLRKLINNRQVEEVGLTVTDILHWSGKYIAYDREASEIGIRILATKAGRDEQDFVNGIEQMVVDRMCKEIITAFLEDRRLSLAEADTTLDMLLNAYPLDVHLEGFVKAPIVAAGACSYAFVPEVARRMHTHCEIPNDSDVCNALGCIVGAIVEKVTISVRRSMLSVGFGGGEASTGNFQVLSPGICELYACKEEAIERAKNIAITMANRKAEMSGAIDISVSVEVFEHNLPVRSDWRGGSTEAIWAASEVTATAVGKPSYWNG
jgi:N-methylhydantoinase A/oxoprolinase/acetone carboxylase beta subunit